ncbi:MAG: ribose-phosphate pyrophosphokinase [Fimbriimonadaceae bacterium]|nr:ribose-phosphate pyrophosphokinase [Fimbriimonadaceae bacterium]
MNVPNPRTTVKVFATTGMDDLGKGVENEMRCRLADHPDYAVEAGELSVSKFSNENIEVQISNVRDHLVLVLHTQVPPVSDGLIQLFALLDAINNAHPRQVFLVFPYMPYSRSDRKNRPRISVMGQRLPEILNRVLGVHRVMLLAPHDPHIKQYFIPTADEVPVLPMLVDFIRREYLSRWAREDCAIVFADSAAAKRFEEVPSVLGLDPAYIYKSRIDHSESPTVKAITGRVDGRHCFIVDDEILTGNTVMRDAAILKEQGAASVHVLGVHGVLADQRLSVEELMAKLSESDVDEFVVTDSIPLGDKVRLMNGKLTVIPIAPLLGETCKRLILGESLSVLHRMGV